MQNAACYHTHNLWPISDLREFIRALEKNNELKRIPFEVDPHPRDHRIRRPRGETGRPRAALRTAQGLQRPGADQRLRLHAQDGDRARSGVGGRGGAAHRRVPGNAHARRPHRQAQDAAETGRDGRVLSQDRVQGAVPGSGAAPTASRCSIIPCCNAGPKTAAASSRCRWSSRAIPTPASATAACTACRSSTSAPPGMHWQTHKQGAEHYRRMQTARAQAHGRRRGHRRRPGHHVLGDSAAAARPRRDDDRRLPAAELRWRW